MWCTRASSTLQKKNNEEVIIKILSSTHHAICFFIKDTAPTFYIKTKQLKCSATLYTNIAHFNENNTVQPHPLRTAHAHDIDTSVGCRSASPTRCLTLLHTTTYNVLRSLLQTNVQNVLAMDTSHNIALIPNTHNTVPTHRRLTRTHYPNPYLLLYRFVYLLLHVPRTYHACHTNWHSHYYASFCVLSALIVGTTHCDNSCPFPIAYSCHPASRAARKHTIRMP